MTADEWVAQIRSAVEKYFPSAELDVEIVRGTRVKARLQVRPGCFLDLFFREETGRADYTLIDKQRRAYGIDNLDGWHEHPLEDPDSHQACDEPQPDDAIRRLRNASDRLASSTTP